MRVENWISSKGIWYKKKGKNNTNYFSGYLLKYLAICDIARLENWLKVNFKQGVPRFTKTVKSVRGDIGKNRSLYDEGLLYLCYYVVVLLTHVIKMKLLINSLSKF